MALKVSSIDELDAALVAQAQAELTQFLQEKYPELELARGVIHDIILFLSGGISGAINQTEINRVLQSQSLLEIQNNPQLADEELVDRVVSNYLISRRTGSRARGSVTVVVSGSGTVVVPVSTLYIANGLNYRTDAAITARPPGTTITAANDRVLQSRGDGSYEFSIPVTAELVGSAGNARSGAKFVPDPIPSRFVTAYATDDFTGGEATESNAQLVQRMASGIAAKVTAGRANIDALVKSQATFADARGLSIVGFGNAEMTRDQRGLFPISAGGRIDIYAQMAAQPQAVTLRKTATVVEIGHTSSVWQFNLTRDDAPGFYEVETVRRPSDPTDTAGFTVITDIRGFDLGDDPWTPDIQTAAEATYTRYQTAVIRFTDTLTPVGGLAIGDTAEYVVQVLAQPYIDELQDFLHSDAHRHLASDVLVRAAVLCVVSINITITKDANESDPDTDAIAQAIVTAVNSTSFPGELYASQIAAAAAPYLTGTQAVNQIVMQGHIRRPTGDRQTLVSRDTLTIPNSPSVLVTPKTTTFTTYAENVAVAVTNRSI